MTLTIDDYLITGRPEEIVEFIRLYKGQSKEVVEFLKEYNAGTICNISPDTLDDLVCFYEGRPINSMSDAELREAIHIVISKIDKACDLGTLSHEELVDLLITYAPKNFGHL